MKKFKNTAVAIASLLIFINSTHAQASKAGQPVNEEDPMAVKFLGNDGNFLTFRVTMLSQIPDYAFLAIGDKNEGVLYSAFFTTKYKVQKVKIEKRDDQVLNFKLIIDKKTYSKSYSVNAGKLETATAIKDVSKL